MKWKANASCTLYHLAHQATHLVSATRPRGKLCPIELEYDNATYARRHRDVLRPAIPLTLSSRDRSLVVVRTFARLVHSIALMYLNDHVLR